MAQVNFVKFCCSSKEKQELHPIPDRMPSLISLLHFQHHLRLFHPCCDSFYRNLSLLTFSSYHHHTAALPGFPLWECITLDTHHVCITYCFNHARTIYFKSYL